MFNKINVNGNEIGYKRINNDVYGNPRYLMHCSDLGITFEEYLDGKIVRKLGLKKYKGKDFSGGVVITSYSLEDDIKRILDKLGR